MDEADNKFIAGFIMSKSGPENKQFISWIGLSCLTNEYSSCRWVDGTPMGYSNFARGTFHSEEQK